MSVGVWLRMIAMMRLRLYELYEYMFFGGRTGVRVCAHGDGRFFAGTLYVTNEQAGTAPLAVWRATLQPRGGSVTDTDRAF